MRTARRGERGGERRDRAAWTLVLAAGTLLALAPTVGLISPRSRSAAEPPSEPRIGTEHEPPTPPLVAPRPPREDGETPSARASPAEDSARKAEDAEHELRAPAPASMNHAPDLARLEIRVTRAGREVPGAAIELLHERREHDESDGSSATLHATDEHGLLRLELAPGTARAVAWSEDACALPASAALEANSTARLELELEPAFPFTGRVLDAATGAPIAGATVALWTFAERDTATTGADGSFRHPRFPALAPAQQIAARAAGYGTTVRYLRVAADGSWKLPACTSGAESLRGCGTPWVELALVRELRVAGRVLAPGGAALSGALVSAEGFHHVLPSVAARDHAAARSDADGRFELSGLRSDVGHSLLIEATGCAHELLELGSEATVLDGAVLELGEIVLAPETILAGAAVDADGRPLAGVEIVLRISGAEAPLLARGERDVPVRIQGRELRATTTADGAFLFEHLAPRPVTLSLAHETGASAELELQPRPDGSFDAPCLTLAPASVAAAPR